MRCRGWVQGGRWITCGADEHVRLFFLGGGVTSGSVQLIHKKIFKNQAETDAEAKKKYRHEIPSGRGRGRGGGGGGATRFRNGYLT